jgi:hypothetical protein
MSTGLRSVEESWLDRLERLVDLASSITGRLAETLQRIAIILSDLCLIVYSFVAIREDWQHRCAESLHLYGFFCVMMCMFDLILELRRVATETQLDFLQTQFRSLESSPASDGGLLDDLSARSPPKTVSQGSVTGGGIGRGVKREKAVKQKRAAELHRWSLGFTCTVSIVFSFFAAHDSECRLHVPRLYYFIQVFTYVFILRLGALVLSFCCRVVKDYEDAAASHQGLPRNTREMAAFPGGDSAGSW